MLEEGTRSEVEGLSGNSSSKEHLERGSEVVLLVSNIKMKHFISKRFENLKMFTKFLVAFEREKWRECSNGELTVQTAMPACSGCRYVSSIFLIYYHYSTSFDGLGKAKSLF